jgi:ATP-dependent RNA helicase SUPV3L1/SUV3
VRDAVEALTPEDRRVLRRAGVTIGTLDLFDARMLKPAAQQWRAALAAAREGRGVAATAPAGATVLPSRGGASFGYRRFGAQLVRIDLVERLARAAHDARAGRRPFVPDPAFATSIGLGPDAFLKLMVELGFRRDTGTDEPERWRWRGTRPRGGATARPAPPAHPDHPFARLRELGLGNG